MIGRAVLLTLLAFAGAAGGRAQSIRVDVSFPYAFHGWNTVGCCADAGYDFAGRDFLGLEWTRFNPKPVNAYPGVGPVRVDQRIEALQIAYRHSFPLARLGFAGDHAPLELYVGAGAGLGRVRQELPRSPAALSALGPQLAAENTELSGELVAGLQLDLGPRFGIRAGFRYLDSFNNVNQFGAGVNTDTKALEVGASWRF
jgi:hypothetical protein